MWAKLDDGLEGHPKILAAGGTLGKNGAVLALGFYVSCVLYANRYLTDGIISDAVMAHMGHADKPVDIAAALVGAGLLHRIDGGYRIHDYHDHNPSAESVRRKREVDRERKRAAA